VSAPHFNILTQQEIVIDLSRPALNYVIDALQLAAQVTEPSDVQCEVDNFRNLLQNLLDRSEPETGNLDLVGE
jgi:hypothetical protein